MYLYIQHGVNTELDTEITAELNLPNNGYLAIQIAVHKGGTLLSHPAICMTIKALAVRKHPIKQWHTPSLVSRHS